MYTVVLHSTVPSQPAPSLRPRARNFRGGCRKIEARAASGLMTRLNVGRLLFFQLHLFTRFCASCSVLTIHSSIWFHIAKLRYKWTLWLSLHSAAVGLHAGHQATPSIAPRPVDLHQEIRKTQTPNPIIRSLSDLLVSKLLLEQFPIRREVVAALYMAATTSRLIKDVAAAFGHVRRSVHWLTVS